MMTQEKIKPEPNASHTSNSEVEWNAETEVQLFYAMRGHKPVGVSRNFQMICILESFMNSTSKDVSSKVIWDHLDTLYDMEALHENEEISFPNDDVDFTIEGIPEFQDLIAEKINVSPLNNSDKSNDSHTQTHSSNNTNERKVNAKSNVSNNKLNDSVNSPKKTVSGADSAKSESKDENLIVKQEKDDTERPIKSNPKKSSAKIETSTKSSSATNSSAAKKRRLNLS